MSHSIRTKFAILIFSFILPNSVFSQSDLKVIDYGNNKEAGNFISIHGVKQYFEIYGQGTPLVLIHGNGGNIAYMKPQIEFFAKKYKVIVMDCRGRGKSELGKDSLTYNQITKDIVGILDYLQLDSTYVVGRSDGGIIALLMAIYHPEKVKKLVSFAANLTPDTLALYSSFYNEVVRDRKLADQMLVKNDNSQNWKVIQQRNRMMEFQPHISASDLQKIKCPVLVMSTDRDVIREEHTVSIYRNIKKANLCILTGENHYVSKNNPELFNTTVQKYLEETYKGEELRQ
ncbi:alpha/beta hydrolase [Cytophagaceae bacterium 50C-KIRBA]|uniref:Alpha/beta hydrolase n=1 Tax=Aquirufa beregesia TaxID=2516556 RepID=A0ABX0F0B9_9BACT|nr:alpha/beta hydrolase [Aquirufa beregesia]NGZ44912.1 alpha/beta hydrolase [Aquirufa beregesia]